MNFTGLEQTCSTQFPFELLASHIESAAKALCFEIYALLTTSLQVQGKWGPKKRFFRDRINVNLRGFFILLLIWECSKLKYFLKNVVSVLFKTILAFAQLKYYRKPFIQYIWILSFLSGKNCSTKVCSVDEIQSWNLINKVRVTLLFPQFRFAHTISLGKVS